MRGKTGLIFRIHEQNLSPLKELVDEKIEELKESGKIALFSPKFNHNNEQGILIFYNNPNIGATLYIYDKEKNVYALKKNPVKHSYRGYFH